MTRLSRRDVLKLGGLALTAPYLGSPRWARGLTAVGSFPVPPRLPLIRPEPGLVEAELSAAWTQSAVAGTTARLQTYNGSFPGPILRLREGERVRLWFTNNLGEPSNLHMHGLHVPPSIDNPFLSVSPGETTVYEFDVPANSAGTYWYHPHLHMRVARQLFGGLAGVIVVEGRMDRQLRRRGADEYVVVLKDLSLVNGAPEAHNPFDWMSGKEGNLLLVNGAVQPVLVPRTSLLRLRLLNASNARYYRLALEGHPLFLIATDGGFIDQPIELNELLLAPGERADVLVQLNTAGNFRLLNLPYDRGSGHGMGGMHGGGHMGGMHGGSTGSTAAPDVLMTIAAGENPPRSLPSRVGLVEPLAPAPGDVHRRLVLGEAMMGFQFYLNGRTFDEARIDFQGRLGDLEVWEIDNRTGMDHPMHLHTYPFQVLSRNGVPEALRAWKDVVNVRAGEVVRIAVPLRDFTGKTVYHCHIVEHEDRGMMGVLAV